MQVFNPILSRVPWTGALVLMGMLTGSLLGEGADAAAVFGRLKGLEGTWTGSAQQLVGEPHSDEQGFGPSVIHEFRVSAAGSVVMEIMGPGTPHEMINMYHLDGPDLLLTHYCAAGNQPTMKLNLAESGPDNLVFDFTGGTNLNPEVDQHIHSSRLVFGPAGAIESHWTSYSQGKPEAEMLFILKRSQH